LEEEYKERKEIDPTIEWTEMDRWTMMNAPRRGIRRAGTNGRIDATRPKEWVGVWVWVWVDVSWTGRARHVASHVE